MRHYSNAKFGMFFCATRYIKDQETINQKIAIHYRHNIKFDQFTFDTPSNTNPC